MFAHILDVIKDSLNPQISQLMKKRIKIGITMGNQILWEDTADTISQDLAEEEISMTIWTMTEMVII